MATATASNPGQKFAWRDASRFAVSAQVVGEELARIGAEAGLPFDGVKPGRVVEEARPEDAPLHPAFEWRDEIAAEKFREHQAGQLIRSVRVVQQEADDSIQEPRKMLAYASVVVPDAGRCYVATPTIMEEPDLRAQAIIEALTLLKGVRARFGHLKELSAINDEIDRLARTFGR